MSAQRPLTAEGSGWQPIWQASHRAGWEALAGRLEDARTQALASLARTQRGPADVPLRKEAGQ
jgi:hypothetical protein